ARSRSIRGWPCAGSSDSTRRAGRRTRTPPHERCDPQRQCPTGGSPPDLAGARRRHPPAAHRHAVDDTMTDRIAYRPAEVADLLRVQPVTVYRMVRAGTLARLPGIGRVLIPAWSVEDYIDGRGRARHGDGGQAGERSLPDRGHDGRRPARLATSPDATRGGARSAAARRDAGAGPRSLAPDARGMAPFVDRESA